MNAADQAKSIKAVSKIAAATNLMLSEFPDLAVDLSPWLKNAETHQFDDPDSIDLGFHFPGRSITCQSRSILMQIRLLRSASQAKPIGIELSGHDHTGQQWWFTTLGQAEFFGAALPLPKVQATLKQVCEQVLHLYNPAAKR